MTTCVLSSRCSRGDETPRIILCLSVFSSHYPKAGTNHADRVLQRSTPHSPPPIPAVSIRPSPVPLP